MKTRRWPLRLGIALSTIAILVGPSFAQVSNRAPDANATQAQAGRNSPLSIDELRSKLRGQLTAITKSLEHKANFDNQLRSLNESWNQVQARKNNYPVPLSIETIDQQIQLLNKEIENNATQLAAEQNKATPNSAIIDSMRNSIERLRSGMNELQIRKARYPEETDRYTKYQEGVDAQLTQLENDISKVKADMTNDESTFNNNMEALQGTQDDIAVLLASSNQTNSFKLNMSGAFAALVGFVIFGFFAVSFYDPKVREVIFSHESGIQFITLFSLVIAIILFGIIGILEAKELAALLGGLSGYILGRGTTAGSGSASGTS